MTSHFKAIERCFKTAGNLILPFPFDGFKATDIGGLEGLEVVHGVVSAKGRHGEIRIAHAWIEGICSDSGPMVVEFVNGQKREATREQYYDRRKVNESETVRYSCDQVRERIFREQHYGPWEGAPAIHHKSMVIALHDKSEPREKGRSGNVRPLIRQPGHKDPLGIKESDAPINQSPAHLSVS